MSYVDTMIDDMVLFHDAPCDVLQAISGWGSGANYPEGYSRPPSWTAAYGIKWFHIMEDCPSNLLSPGDQAKPWRVPGPYTGNTSTNTRVQCRDLQIWFLLPNGTWFLHGHATTPGSTMYPITWNESSGQLNNNTWRSESGGGASIRVLGYGTYENYVWHSFTSPRELPTSYLAIATAFYGRLILDDEGGTDDRANAHILAAGSGDYYRDSGVLSSPKQTGVNTEPMGYGRLKYVTNDWQLFSFWSRNTIAADELRLNPPPLIGLSLLDDQGGGGGGVEPPVFTPIALPARGTWFAKTSGGDNAWNTHAVASTPANKVRRRRGVKLWS